MTTIASPPRAASQEMNGIVDLIRNIAGQINLLALNATIEAARAGDAGKGAAIGAGVGLVGGSANQSEANRMARERAAAEEAYRKGTAVADLKRAYAACMDAKGYSVK